MAIINDPTNTQCCGFCKSICTLNGCSTKDCPGPKTPKLIDRERIRKYQMRALEKSQFKKFVEDPNNESLFFGVYCGTNLKVTIDKDDPSKKHRTTCQSKQTIVHDVGSYPFLTMKPSHKDDCPFKPTIKS